jgi:uncharacterized cupin superfamily protein
MRSGIVALLAVLLAGLLCALAWSAVADSHEGGEQKPPPAPVRIDRDRLAGLELTEWDPWPKEAVLEGSPKHRGHVFFADEIVVEVWEAGPARFAIADPFPYDEYVQVLSGKLILTDAKGQRSEYVEGDQLVVPKGFTGTWHMFGNYRELVVIERKAYERAEGPVTQ